MVLLMQGGFCCLESGLVRTKNNINVAIKNFIDFCISSVIFWGFGFAIMFGVSFNGLFGITYFFFESSGNSWLLSFFIFQMLFCGTASTIVSGSVSERTSFKGYLIISVIISGLIYPVIGHWLWRGVAFREPNGWLANQGFLDFAGATVVHSTGAWVALAAVIVIGPRLGRFDKGSPPIEGQNLSMAVLGIFLLWFGWLGFNGGSALKIDDRLPVIFLNTILSGSFGALATLALTWCCHKKPSVPLVINGALAGLVGITASCNIMRPYETIIIGIVAGLICFVTTIGLEKLRIDDVVGAVPAHGFAGVWGTLAVALFSEPELWGTGLSRWEQFLIQAQGAAVCFAWAFGGGWLLIWLINRWLPLRIEPEGEKIGLNVAEHNANSALLDLLQEMELQKNSKDFSQQVGVEPHTEIGRIALQYNRVLKQIGVKEKEQKESNEKLQEFAYIVSHDLKAPARGNT